MIKQIVRVLRKTLQNYECELIIIIRTCISGTHCDVPGDVVFLMDGSDSIADRDFHQTESFRCQHDRKFRNKR